MPTQKEIAQAAGVSRSTVTRALRDDAQISRAERERIRTIAEEMGYRPNPMINALMEQLRTGRPARFQSVLAWVVAGGETGDGDHVAAARARAEELGYGLEVFPVGDSNPAAFLRMLRARGIRGLLFAPMQLSHRLGEWNLEHFCGVTVGFRLGNPALHFVMNDFFCGGLVVALPVAG